MFLYLVQQNIINGDWPVSAVEDQRHSIVIEIDGPQEDIHHSPTVVLVVDIPAFQRIEKRLNLWSGECDLFPHLDGKLALQFVLFLFTLFDALGNHIHRLPALQRFPEIFYGGIRLLNCRLDALDGGAVIVSLASGGNRKGDFLNVAVRQQLAALQNYPVLDFLLVDYFLPTGLFLGTLAGVITVGRPGFPCAAVAGHHLPAVAAEQLRCQQIFLPPSGTGRGFFIAVKNLLYSLKKLVLDDTGHTARCFRVFVGVIADVSFIPQKAVQTVLVELLALGGFDLFRIEILCDFSDGFPAGVHLKNLPNNSGPIRVNMEAAFLVHIVAKAGVAPVAQTLFGVNIHAPPYLLGQLRRIVFGHALQHALHQNAAGVVADVLPCGDHPNAVLFQLGLVNGAVVAVPSEAVKLIDKDALKNVLVAVGNHALELGPAVRCTALSPLDVFADYDMSVVLGELIAGLKLVLNRLLRLAVAGIAGVNDDVHSFTPSNISTMAFFKRSFMGEAGSKHISTNRLMFLSSSKIFGLNSYSLPCGLSVRQQI